MIAVWKVLALLVPDWRMSLTVYAVVQREKTKGNVKLGKMHEWKENRHELTLEIFIIGTVMGIGRKEKGFSKY